MNFEIGWVVVIAAMVFFYLRMYQLRGKRRREARQMELERLKAGAKRKASDAPLPSPKEQVTYQVGSWVLLALGAGVMLLGLAMRTATWIPELFLPYWWAVTTLGVVLFTLGFK
jgi:hypothetical protein